MSSALPLDDDFLCQCSFLARSHEEVDAVGTVPHLVGVGVGVHGVVGLEVVKQGASHVIDLDLDLACEVLEVECHLSLVGVGHDGEVGLCLLLVDAVEGADQPVPLNDAVVRGAAVEGVCGKPNGIFNVVEDVQLAALCLVAEGLKHPFGCAVAIPGDGVPVAVGVGVPEVEVIGIDLELGGGDDPVRGGVVKVHGVDGRGVRRVFHGDVHGDEAVAVGHVLVSPVVGAGHDVDLVLVVGIEYLVSSGIPEVLVAGLLLGDGEGALVVVVDGEVEGGLALAAEGVDVVVGVDGAFSEGHVDVEVVVEPTVVVAAGGDDVIVEVGPELEVEDDGAVARTVIMDSVVVNARLVVGDAVGTPGELGAAE